MISVLKPPAPAGVRVLFFPPFAQLLVRFRRGLEDAVFEQVEVYRKSLLVARLRVSVAELRADRAMYPRIPVRVTKGDFHAEFVRLVEQARHKAREQSLFLSQRHRTNHAVQKATTAEDAAPTTKEAPLVRLMCAKAASSFASIASTFDCRAVTCPSRRPISRCR